MTRLKATRKKFKLKLREVGERLGIAPASVHDSEKRGIQTKRAAQRYAKAFPGIDWKDLID